MWYEILPAFGIIAGVMALPGIGAYHLNKFVNGNPYRRDLSNRWDRGMYSRDRRLYQDPYNTKGLDAIPDQ